MNVFCIFTKIQFARVHFNCAFCPTSAVIRPLWLFAYVGQPHLGCFHFQYDFPRISLYFCAVDVDVMCVCVCSCGCCTFLTKYQWSSSCNLFVIYYNSILVIFVDYIRVIHLNEFRISVVCNCFVFVCQVAKFGSPHRMWIDNGNLFLAAHRVTTAKRVRKTWPERIWHWASTEFWFFLQTANFRLIVSRRWMCILVICTLRLNNFLAIILRTQWIRLNWLW